MNENKAKQEHYDENTRRHSSGGKNTISGDALKAKMKSGEMNT